MQKRYKLVRRGDVTRAIRIEIRETLKGKWNGIPEVEKRRYIQGLETVLVLVDRIPPCATEPVKPRRKRQCVRFVPKEDVSRPRKNQ